MTSGRSCHRHDQHTRQDHNANLHAAWTTKMPNLVLAYLTSKSDLDKETMM